tara:strand:+ start:114 stop:893 length:780 start_codon:yes stop_codon:yes gene_type:complete
MYYSKKLKKFKKIDHCFFSKKGGLSKGIYKSLNCGRGSKDDRKNIEKNLNFISKKMGVSYKNLILMHQTHSNKVIELNRLNHKKKLDCDAIITKNKNVCLGVVTADCVPILFYDFIGGIVGCIHAGWKGAYSGIIENTFTKLRKINPKNKVFASIGPCIGAKSYEVNLQFYKKFILKSKKNKKYFKNKKSQKKLFDLRGYVADKLLTQNVLFDHVKFDTFQEKDNFFSYRRSIILGQKDYGRCISVIRLNYNKFENSAK